MSGRLLRVRWFASQFLVVVTGVLVALLVNARGERSREAAYLAALRGDFATNRLDLQDRTYGSTTSPASPFPADCAGAMRQRGFWNMMQVHLSLAETRRLDASFAPIYASSGCASSLG